MASRYLIAGKTDWSDTASWAGGVVPVDNDDVFILEGAQTVSAGLGQSAINLNSLFIGPDFKGNIGSDSAPLEINGDGASPTKFTWAATGGGYCKIKGTIPVMDAIGQGTLYAAGGTWAKLNAAGSARVVFDASCEITVTTGRIIVSSQGASVVIPAKTGGGTTTCALAVVTAGKLQSARTILTAQVGAYNGVGELTLTDGAAVSTLLEMLGGTVRPLASGVITLLNAYAGILDPTGNRYGDLTITNSVIAASAFLRSHYPGGKIVFTNDPTYAGPPQSFLGV